MISNVRVIMILVISNVRVRMILVIINVPGYGDNGLVISNGLEKMVW